MASEDQTFAQSGKAVSASRLQLIERARLVIAESEDPMPVRRFVVIPRGGDFDGVHPSGVSVSDQVFFARTREGAMVAYFDWINANWATGNGEGLSGPIDIYPAPREDWGSYVDWMFNCGNPVDHDSYFYLHEVGMDPEEHDAFDVLVGASKAAK